VNVPYVAFFSAWSNYIEPKTVQVYGYAILLGVGGSLSLVTCLGMLSHLIGENVVSRSKGFIACLAVSTIYCMVQACM
jgi:hypothetical protein